MTEIAKVFTSKQTSKNRPSDPTLIKHKDFYLDERIKSEYITLNIFSYAFMKETAYRALATLSYDSLCFLGEHRPQFHRLFNGLQDLELEEVEDNLGRDTKDNHSAAVNFILSVDPLHILTGSSDCTLKVWKLPIVNEDEYKPRNLDAKIKKAREAELHNISSLNNKKRKQS